MKHTNMIPGQDPDEFLYIMGSCRGRLIRSILPEGPIDRKYEDIPLQTLSSDTKVFEEPTSKGEISVLPIFAE